MVSDGVNIQHVASAASSAMAGVILLYVSILTWRLSASGNQTTFNDNGHVSSIQLNVAAKAGRKRKNDVYGLLYCGDNDGQYV